MDTDFEDFVDNENENTQQKTRYRRGSYGEYDQEEDDY